MLVQQKGFEQPSSSKVALLAVLAAIIGSPAAPQYASADVSSRAAHSLATAVPPVAARAFPVATGKAFREGVAAASTPQAAEEGAKVLEQGGNAIDAAAVMQFVLNVVEPQASGIGGGGFMMIYLAKTGETFVIDSRERAPAAATAEMFASQSDFMLRSTSGYSVGVPGTLLGVGTALDRWGTISLADAVQPAIRFASEGFPVGARLAEVSDSTRLKNECGTSNSPPYDVARGVFRPGGDRRDCGRALTEGEILVQPDLARTFRLIADHGINAFYDCKHPAGIAKAIVQTQRETRSNNPDGIGRMSCDDLWGERGYKIAIRTPTVGEYRGYIIKSAPPPSSGGLRLWKC